MAKDLELTTKHIVARLDEYSPELNTGLMDGRVQDAILKYPIIRCLNVPENDQQARRRCVKLMHRVVAAATPVLPLILQDSAPIDGGSGSPGNQNTSNKSSEAVKTINLGPPFKPMNIPQLSMETENRLMNYITALSEKEPLIHFWMGHHVEYQKAQTTSDKASSPLSKKGKVGGLNGRKRRFSSNTYNEMKQKITSVDNRGSNANYTTESTLNLYIRLKIFQDIFNDLNDRVQGAICMVFWECWDEIYATLATIVGDDEMQKADSGRLFRVSGDAALYIDSRRASKKMRMSERQRLAPVAEEVETQSQNQNQNQSQTHNNHDYVAFPSPGNGASRNPSFVSESLFTNMGANSNSNKYDFQSSNHGTSNSNSSPGFSASPASLVTDDSKDSSSLSGSGYTENDSVLKKDSSSSTDMGASSGEQLVNANANAQTPQLIDSSELDFVFDDTFLKPGSERKGRSEIDLFTTLHDVGDLLKSRVSSSTSLKDLKNVPVLDLRARIKMMEDGASSFDLMDEGDNGHAKIVW